MRVHAFNAHVIAKKHAANLKASEVVIQSQAVSKLRTWTMNSANHARLSVLRCEPHSMFVAGGKLNRIRKYVPHVPDSPDPTGDEDFQDVPKLALCAKAASADIVKRGSGGSKALNAFKPGFCGVLDSVFMGARIHSCRAI